MPDDFPELTYKLTVPLTRGELVALQTELHWPEYSWRFGAGPVIVKVKTAVDALLQAGREGEGQ